MSERLVDGLVEPGDVLQVVQVGDRLAFSPQPDHARSERPVFRDNGGQIESLTHSADPVFGRYPVDPSGVWAVARLAFRLVGLLLLALARPHVRHGCVEYLRRVVAEGGRVSCWAGPDRPAKGLPLREDGFDVGGDEDGKAHRAASSERPAYVVR